jgi:hypothetical protein
VDVLSDPVELLAAPVSPPHQTFIACVWSAFLEEHAWPFWDYVDGHLEEQGLDAGELLRAFPSWTFGSIGRYSAIWVPRLPLPGPEDEVALTLVGLEHAGQSARAHRKAVWDSIRYFADRLVQTPHSPRARWTVDITAEQLEEHLAASRHLPANWQPDFVLTALEHEPVPWRVGSVRKANGPWRLTIDRRIRAYAAVSSLRGYLQPLSETILPPPMTLQPMHPSSLTLPEALDYLDVVWRVRFDSPLLRLPGAAKTSQLALNCSTSEDFYSRLSALSDLLSRISVPRSPEVDPKEGPLVRLRRFLEPEVPDGRQRIATAVDTLRAIVGVRAGQQHHGAKHKEAHGFRQLGLTYPPPSWSQAWSDVQLLSTQALNAIREEVEGSFND